VTSSRTIAFVTGVLFIITFITSIPAAFVFYPPVLTDPTYIISAGADMGVKVGALLEVILVVANIGTAVVLYPLIKRRTPSSPWAMSRLGSWKAPSSRSASSASCRS
jgi:hypothetical protein